MVVAVLVVVVVPVTVVVAVFPLTGIEADGVLVIVATVVMDVVVVVALHDAVNQYLCTSAYRMCACRVGGTR